MTRASQVRVIREAYADIPDMQDGFYDVRERLFDMNEAAERRHRKGAPYGIQHGLSVKDAAKLFTVSHLLDGWKEPEKWSVDEILHIRNEVLYAQAYAKKHHDELAAWVEKWAGSFAEVNYSDLMKVAA